MTTRHKVFTYPAQTRARLRGIVDLEGGGNFFPTLEGGGRAETRREGRLT
jgi:hypothetical protein